MNVATVLNQERYAEAIVHSVLHRLSDSKTQICVEITCNSWERETRSEQGKFHEC